MQVRNEDDWYAHYRWKSSLIYLGGCAHAIAQLYYLYHLKSGDDLPPLVTRSRTRANSIIDISEFGAARRAFKRDLKHMPQEEEIVKVSNDDKSVEFYVCFTAASMKEHDIEVGLTNDADDQLA
jgi:hypothetical protein